MLKIALLIALPFLLATSIAAQKPEPKSFEDAQHLYADGKLYEAEISFTRIVHQDPENIAAQMYLGQTLFQEQKYAAAVAPY